MGRINKHQVFVATVAAVGIGWPAVGSAQLIEPLDTVPKPSLVVGLDTSVTMKINSGCTSCHASTVTRLDEAKVDIQQTLPLFDRYFNYGYFEYRGCGTAHALNHIIPRDDGVSNLAPVLGSIAGASACNSKERRLPGAPQGTCLTPGCAATDGPVLMSMAQMGLLGFNPFAPFVHAGCAWNPQLALPPPPLPPLPCLDGGGAPVLQTSSLPAYRDASGLHWGCYHHSPDGGGPPTCDFTSTIGVNFLNEARNFIWPRWEPTSMSWQQVRDEFCNPMRDIARTLWADMQACFGGSPPYMTNGSVISTINSSTFCDPVQIAATGCQPGSPLFNTCVCDDTLPGCEVGVGASACGTPLTFKARQQVAMCELRRNTGAPPTAPATFYDFFESQPDNAIYGGCRENAAVIFSDGYMGDTAGALNEAGLARTSYLSANPIGNVGLFRISNVFASSANALMGGMTAGNLTTAYDATNLASMQQNFAALLNRMYQGNYTGSAMTMDAYGTVAVTTSFSVPGYRGVAQPTDTYLGWPQRVAMHSVNPTTGALGPALWETDWNSKASSQAACYKQFYGPNEVPISAGGTPWIVANRGPDGQFSNGVNRSVLVGTGGIDRDNFGGTNSATLRYGRMYGTATTRPVLVERGAADAGGLRDQLYKAHLAAIQNRPRMIYTMGGGYVYGIHGGDAQVTANSQKRIAYNSTSGNAGREVFRYSPEFVDLGRGYPTGPNNSTGNAVTYDIDVNPIVPQPMTTGQLSAREVLIDHQNNRSPEYRTILVGAQGRNGRGFFAMDVTDPCAPNVLSEWALTSGSATNEPMLYDFPRAPAALPPVNGISEYFAQPAVVVTNGLGAGTPRIYAYDPVTGAVMSSTGLPGGTDYPTEPVCVDVVGSGMITHCYVVGRNGTLARVPVDAATGQFGPSVNITPNVPPYAVDTTLTYSTRPAVFFGLDGAVNVLYGSGDYQNLNTPVGGNRIYKAVDTDSRVATIGTARASTVRACNSTVVPAGVLSMGTQRVLSPPTVTKGVVAWTTYEPGTNGCIAGQARLYAMDFVTCNDAIDPTPATPQAPTGQGIGDGIPTSPVLHEGSSTIVASTSVVVEGSQAATVNNVLTRGVGVPVVNRLYWKLETPNP